MSTDLSIYSSSETPITHVLLHQTLRKKKWLLIVEAGGKIVEPAEIPLAKKAIHEVYGVTEAALFKKVRAIVEKRDYGKLDQLYGNSSLNSVYLTVSPFHSDDVVLPAKFRADGKRLKLSYNLNGHGGDLQCDLWDLLGTVIPGLMEDPQSGDFRRCGPKRT